MHSMKNHVQLIGNLGRDIDIKETKTGKKYAKFSVATNESYNNQTGERVSDVQWHNVTAWGKTAEIMAKILAKGNEVAIEGRLTYSKYEDKEGVTKYTTDIVVNEFHKLTRSAVPV